MLRDRDTEMDYRQKEEGDGGAGQVTEMLYVWFWNVCAMMATI